PLLPSFRLSALSAKLIPGPEAPIQERVAGTGSKVRRSLTGAATALKVRATREAGDGTSRDPGSGRSGRERVPCHEARRTPVSSNGETRPGRVLSAVRFMAPLDRGQFLVDPAGTGGSRRRAVPVARDPGVEDAVDSRPACLRRRCGGSGLSKPRAPPRPCPPTTVGARGDHDSGSPARSHAPRDRGRRSVGAPVSTADAALRCRAARGSGGPPIRRVHLPVSPTTERVVGRLRRRGLVRACLLCLL